jgi:hypothetical protein
MFAPLVLAFSFVAQAPAAAPAHEVAAPTGATLATAVRALDAQPVLYLVGDVAEHARESEGESRGGAQVIVRGGGDDTPAFRGAIEVLRTDRKELLIASMRALPEVVVFDDGAHQLVRTTIDDEPVSARRLANDLASLLDLGRLASQLEKTTQLAAGTPAFDGSRGVDCELPARTVRAQGQGMLALMEPKVLAVRAHFDLDGHGAILGLELSVVRSDPMAHMRRNALQNASNGSSTTTVTSFAPHEGDDAEEGTTSVYRLRPRAETPSVHAREALLAMRKLVEVKRD